MHAAHAGVGAVAWEGGLFGACLADFASFRLKVDGGVPNYLSVTMWGGGVNGNQTTLYVAVEGLFPSLRAHQARHDRRTGRLAAQALTGLCAHAAAHAVARSAPVARRRLLSAV